MYIDIHFKIPMVMRYRTETLTLHMYSAIPYSLYSLALHNYGVFV